MSAPSISKQINDSEQQRTANDENGQPGSNRDISPANLATRPYTSAELATHKNNFAERPRDCDEAMSFDELTSRDAALATANRCLESKTTEQRIAWALNTLPATAILSSSFGAQAAVSLHLLTRQVPDIPVVFIDTGYLFPETYRFTDQLCEKLNLNLKVYRPTFSPAWQEARNGKRWDEGVSGITQYNLENKVKPMQRALQELGAATWFAGLRREQSVSRSERNFIEHQNNVWKVHPILDWSDRDIYNYLLKHDLPYHPLWHKGFVSIGDVHTTQSLNDVNSLEETRFFGLKRECGLHDMTDIGASD